MDQITVTNPRHRVVLDKLIGSALYVTGLMGGTATYDDEEITESELVVIHELLFRGTEPPVIWNPKKLSSASCPATNPR